jgi:hypothetical protein
MLQKHKKVNKRSERTHAVNNSRDAKFYLNIIHYNTKAAPVVDVLVGLSRGYVKIALRRRSTIDS